MSAVADEIITHIESLNVDRKLDENKHSDVNSTDSGLDIVDSFSNAFTTTDSKVPRPSENLVNTENQSEVGQICKDFIENELCSLPNRNSISPDEHVDFNNYSQKSSTTKEEVTNLLTASSNSENIINNETKSFNDNCVNLRTSTVSLDDQKSSVNTNIICMSPYSRSAENLTLIEQNECKGNKNNIKELNTDELLSEYTTHKNKVTAVHKIPEATPDVRYTRIPKEILSQDIGSIVKNVHGIFSSVSGSLKSAYSHRNVQKPIKISKTVNGKVMNDIFEDNDVKIDTDPINVLSETTSNQESLQQENDNRKDVLKLQVESLERLLAEQRKENTSLRERVKQHVDELQERDQTFKELENKFDLMSKRVEQAEREKDAAVMRYASVECAKIEARRAAEASAKAEKAAVAEMELLNNKLKSAHAEKQRICQLYDDKCHELMTSERELAKVREEMRELEGRLKWTQSKLRMEMDAYKESAERAEKLSQQVTELEAAKEAAATNATDSVKAKQLESELKECRAALILCKHESEELERRYSSATQQLDICTRERDAAKDALAKATFEVSRLSENNARLEEEAAELAALRAQAALADTLSAQLQREMERATRAEEALAGARAQASTCARREAAALEHAARLTAQHVAQRNSAQRDHDTAQALSVDNACLRERISALEAEREALQAALAEEADKRSKENRVLARKVAELTEEVSEVTKKLEWEKGENGVLKKRHASAIKELNRELQRTLKRCEQLEAKLASQDATSTRTGSITSLSSGEGPAQEDRLQNGHADNMPDIQVREPDRQALIERIVSLQRAAARRSERCEFLEEHARQLTGELRNKSRLLRSLLCDLPAGAVTSRNMDQNKKEIARLGGGAMAAVWGGDPNGMTLELSLEMNKRLQAVLEDTLLKNITLKENIDTLGAEISRLKEQKNMTTDTK